jgi:hypothetical protein
VFRTDHSQRKCVNWVIACEGQWADCDMSLCNSQVLDTPLVGAKADRTLQHVQCVCEEGEMSHRGESRFLAQCYEEVWGALRAHIPPRILNLKAGHPE